MASRLNPYINFENNAREAMTFYQGIFGGELNISTFGEFGDQANADGVMHAMLVTPAGFTLMASDAPPGMPLDTGSTISVSVSGEDEAELTGYWKGLGEGGTVTMPFEKQMWGDIFGMVTDKFGVQWMVDVVVPQEG